MYCVYPYWKHARRAMTEPGRLLMVQTERRRAMVAYGEGKVVTLACVPIAWVGIGYVRARK